MSEVQRTNPGSGLPPDVPPPPGPDQPGPADSAGANPFEQMAQYLDRLTNKEFLAMVTTGPRVPFRVADADDERPKVQEDGSVKVPPANVTLRLGGGQGGRYWAKDPDKDMNVQEYSFPAARGIPEQDGKGNLKAIQTPSKTFVRLHSPDPTAEPGSNSAEDWTVSIMQNGQHHRQLPDGSWFDKRYATTPNGRQIDMRPYQRNANNGGRWVGGGKDVTDRDTINALDERERSNADMLPYRRDANNNWIDVKGQSVTDKDTLDALDQWQRNMNDCHMPLYPKRPDPPPTDHSPVDEPGGDGGAGAVLQDKASLQQGHAKLQTTNQTDTEDQKADQGDTEKDTGSQDQNWPNKAYQNTSFKLASWELTNAPSNQLARQSWSTPANSPVNASLTTSELGYDTGAGASASVKGNAVDLKAYGSAEAYLAKVEGHAVWNSPGNVVGVAANGKAEVGASVDGAGNVTIDPLHGQVDGKVEAGAFVGAKAEGDAKVDVGPAEADAKGDIGAGLGAKVDADVGFEKGKINVEFGAQAYLGVGGGGDVDFSIDVGKAGTEAIAVGKAAAPVAQAATKAVDNVADNVSKDAANAWNAVTHWV